MTNKKPERRKHALQFYNEFMRSEKKKIAVVIEKEARCCKFITIIAGTPTVIAKSSIGIEGCFMELLENIYSCPQKTYHETGFHEWLEKIYRLRIVYEDELVILFEKNYEFSSDFEKLIFPIF